MVATEVMAQPHCAIVLPHQSGPNSGSRAIAYSLLPQRASFCAKSGPPGSPVDTPRFTVFGVAEERARVADAPAATVTAEPVVPSPQRWTGTSVAATTGEGVAAGSSASPS